MSKAPRTPNSSHSCNDLLVMSSLAEPTAPLLETLRYSPSDRPTNGPTTRLWAATRSPPTWTFANSNPLPVTLASAPEALTSSDNHSYPTPRPSHGSNDSPGDRCSCALTPKRRSLVEQLTPDWP